MADLHSAGHRRGVVCAPHFDAVEAGRSMLAEGGNAIEAMVAMAASIAAVYPHMNHIGGDGFWLIRQSSARVRAIMAPGPAGSEARLELYRERETIPPRGPQAALTVPGAVGGWMLALEATLAHLAQAGLDDFYRGDVGREIAADLNSIGSPVTREDLTRYRATFADPLRIELPTATVYNTDAPTQGVASLMILALFARLGVTQAEGFDHVHGLIEATKRALRLRDRVVTDPNNLAHSLERCLDPRFIAGEAMKIDRHKAAPWPLGGGDGDTIWMGAADTSGLVVSYIQSLYWEFGSGCVLPHTGVLMQNRGTSFSLQRRALNALAPGRLPFHTLNPALATLKDGRIIAYGTMGGDGQPQTQAAVFTRHVLFGEPLADALDRPRWVLGRTWGDAQTKLRLESRFDGNVVDALAAAGHEVDVLDEPYSDVMGHAGAVVLHTNGTCEGAHDPRADGGAAGV
jgi:oxamate amidohydrolase